MGMVFADELAEIRLCGFGLAFDRLPKSKCIRFQRKVFELHLGGFLFVVVVFPYWLLESVTNLFEP